MFEDDDPEWEEKIVNPQSFEPPSFEAPSDLRELESKLKAVIDLSIKLAEFAFNQAKMVALLNARLDLITLELDVIRSKIQPK